MDMRRVCMVVLTTALCCFGARAQFYSAGTDPSSLRWMVRKGENFRLIYPEGNDSLAIRYLSALERHAPRVGMSIGYPPNSMYRRSMPVVLHTVYPWPNGSVSWAPRIMNLHTVQDAYAPDPYPWVDQLAIHESRHVSQMQFGRDRGFAPLFLLSGQLATGGLCAVYGGPTFFEGDAVTAETALTRSGRGRTADFLEYYMVAFDSGDWRDWYRWNYGSLKYYTPDYYRVGYMTVAGMRSLYGDAMFSARFYDNVFRKKTNVLRKTMREASGESFRNTFRAIERHFHEDWADGRDARAPFMRGEEFTPLPGHYEEFVGLVMTDRGLYACRSGLARPSELVHVRADGRSVHVAYRSSGAGAPVWAEESGRLYWSEAVADVRWSLGGDSRIRYYDLSSGRQGDLTRGSRLFNPFPYGGRLYAVEYPVGGGSSVVEIDEGEGSVVRRWPAPDGLQVVEVACDGDRLVVSAIGEDGFGLYDMEAGYACVLAPRHIKVKQLRTVGGTLHFVCDRSGVNEVYSYGGGVLRQLTDTEFGAADYAFSPDGGTMYYSSLSREARSIRRMPAVEGREVDFADVHRYAIADRLSAQEDSLAEARGVAADCAMSAPKAYSKLSHLFRFHSWMPLSLSYDSVSDISGEEVSSLAGLGATAFFQNDLSTMSGYLSYKYHPDGNVRNGFEAHVAYSGLYPVIEAEVEYGARRAYTYRPVRYVGGESEAHVLSVAERGAGYVWGTVRSYIPFNFSSGGWSRGLIPQLELSLGNDIYDKGVLERSRSIGIDREYGQWDGYELSGIEPGGRVLYGAYKVSFRGYSMLGTPSACVWPRLGAGAELGVEGNAGLGKFYSPGAYAYLYGYLPGFGYGQGWRLTALAQGRIKGDSVFPVSRLTIVPRGMADEDAVKREAGYCRSQLKVTADYAIPFAPLDLALGQLAYVRNLELVPHADLLLCRGGGLPGTGSAYSVGASLSARLGNIAFIPYSSRIGVDINYNGGSVPDGLRQLGNDIGRVHVGMLFSIDL